MTNKLTLHWYAEYMHYARTCVQSLSLTYRIVDNIKEVKVAVSGRLATIPVEAIDIVSVFGLLNDKKKRFHYNPSISYVAEAVEGANTIPQLHGVNTGIALPTTSVSSYVTIPEFDNELTYEWTYNEDRTSIVLGYLNDSTDVFIRYKTNGISYSSATVVNSYSEDSILDYIELQVAKNSKERVSMIDMLSLKYKASVRKMKARLSPWGMSELIEGLKY